MESGHSVSPHKIVVTGMTLTASFLLLGVFVESGLHSDLAETGGVLSALALALWAARWARCSRLVGHLLFLSFCSLVFTQILDLSENFPALDNYPILGAKSSWNGTLETAGLSLGFTLVFTALLFAIVESRAGRIADQKYRLLADNVSDVISTLDLNLKNTYISPSVFRMRGFTPEEVLAQQPEDYYTPESLQKARTLLGQELGRIRRGERSPEQGETLELELRCKDGSTIPVESRVSALTGDRGEIKGILAVTRDISDRKRTEEILRRSEARFRTLVESAPVCIHEIDLEGRLCSVNPKGVQMMGAASEEEVLGRHYLDIVGERDRDRVESALNRAYRGENVYCEFEGSRGPDSLNLTSSLVPLTGESGQVVRLMGITNDISEQVAAEQARARLETQLNQAQKMESIGRLAGGVAHDFNNMLGVMLAHAEIALAHPEEVEETRKNLEEIRRFCTRAADLTRQLLAFSRQQTVEPEVLQLNGAMENTISMLKRLIGEDIHLRFLPGENLWPVLIDPSQLDQILANLCVNARDAISGAGTINIATENVTLDREHAPENPEFEPGQYVRLVVQDSGRGMAPQTLEHAFEPFFTTKEWGKGTGLGLATVYGIVKQNKGFINVESALGRGTTMTVHLPRYQGEPKKTPIASARDGYASGAETVLIVEDEPALLRATEAMLARVGYTVLTAASPTAAQKLYRENAQTIGLVLTDVIMPEMNGCELVKLLTQQSPGLKTLYMSGYAADVFGENGILDEGVNFIQKPFTFKQLTLKVRQALD